MTNATGLNYDFNEPLKPEMFQKMWEKSPIRYAKQVIFNWVVVSFYGDTKIGFAQVKTPLLLVLGADDLRVPPKHSTEYRQILKANGTELKYEKTD